MRRMVLVMLLASVAPIARAADGDSVESITQAVYDVISGPAGIRDWARFRSLFAEGARLISMRVTAEGAAPNVMTPDDYSQRAGASFEKNAFYESELSRRVEMFGNIAHVFSTYESRRAPGEKPFARGINSFQLVKDGKAWKVMTILWDQEREGSPLPQKYLVPSAPAKVANSRPAPAEAGAPGPAGLRIIHADISRPAPAGAE
ncbi:MAG: hypothetical protein LAQ69_03860 [Acidobacteriia bacterium]|nr:hypothetical protein [Terriglobia bacterium]